MIKNEKHYIYYILKADELLFAVLSRKSFHKPEKISKLLIRENYVHNLIRRYIRKYKGSTPYSHKESTFTIDAPMYTYTAEDDPILIEITSTKPRKRIRIHLSDQNKHHGNIRIILKEHKIELHHLVKTKQRISWTEKKEIGIDKGYRTLIATSSGNLYGENLNELLNKETERLNEKNKLRNQYWALAIYSI